MSFDPLGWYEKTSDPILFYRLTASIADLDHGKQRTQNAQRIRGTREYAQTPPNGVYRTLWLGDSACCGSCIGDDETAPAIIEKLARKRNQSLEAINLGVVGYNIRQVREVFRQRSSEFHNPATVVYYHHINDIINAPWWRLAPSIPHQLRRDYDPPAPWLRSTLRRSALVQYLAHTSIVHRLRFGPRSANTRTKKPTDTTRLCLNLYASQNEHAIKFNENLKTLAKNVQESGANFVVIWWPTRYAESDPNYTTARDNLRKWTSETGADLIDLTTQFSIGDQNLLYVDPDHPSRQGQHLIAEAVLATLENEQ